ncbi:MBL fold metallo-hydrolase [Salinibacterium sp. G-O1]|uniref:MBL fold metallo-hydrolase n=1 Tax=Salinibacterium sp. G-O1 TaxID=3046208 RepID=UPI0024BBA88E|nr:MBL fold metallo-hydrolase [Salinibacterium sp. G-O1]MDJ0335791.1 MBL fold metallo-hydrolase [Salinibacterium sp. G-O1]
MKITKYEHACMVVQKSSSSLIIDPGAYTTPLTDVTGVVAIVITHEHPDHWTPEHLKRILVKNPDARILGPAGVVAAAKDDDVTIEAVAEGDELDIGQFSLKFFGDKHAVIHESIPVIDNVAVLVDDNFYYAGDSFTLPPGPVDTLAVPINAPWLKVSEVMDYVMQVAPKRAFPVHEALLSKIGVSTYGPRIEWATARGGGEYLPLALGESLDL